MKNNIDSFVQASLSLPRKYSKLVSIKKNLVLPDGPFNAVDVGTSHGALIKPFNEGGNWTFIDLDSHNLEMARQYLKGTFVCANADDVLKTSRNIHVITCFDVLMYFRNPLETYRIFQRCMGDGGLLLLAGTCSQSTIGHFIRSRFLPLNPSGFLNEPRFDETKTALEAVGLQVTFVDYFSGPFIQIGQSIFDVLAFRHDTHSPRDKGDKLTQPILTISRPKALAFSLISIVSFSLNWADRLFFNPKRFSRFYDGYLIRAIKL